MTPDYTKFIDSCHNLRIVYITIKSLTPLCLKVIPGPAPDPLLIKNIYS